MDSLFEIFNKEKMYNNGMFYQEINTNGIMQISFNQFKNELSILTDLLDSISDLKLNIGIIGNNSYPWMLLYFSIYFSKHVIIPLDPNYSLSEIYNVAKKANISLLFISKDTQNLNCDLIEKTPKINTIIPYSNGAKSVASIIECVKKTSPIHSSKSNQTEGIKKILFTSGTTGNPKGVMLSEKNEMCCLESLLEALPIPKNKNTVFVLPLHHTYAQLTLLHAIRVESCISFSNSFKYIERDMRTFSPYFMYVVPAHIENLLRMYKNKKKHSNCMDNFGLKEFLGGNLQIVTIGGAPTDAITIDYLISENITPITGYGLTECSPLVAFRYLSRNDYDNKTAGTIIKCNEVRICDNEIQIKGENVMLGYYNNKEETDNVFDDGWLKTGDNGLIVGDNLYVTGRNTNTIVLSNGENVYPEDLEEKIRLNNGLLDCVIFDLGSNSINSAPTIGLVLFSKSHKNNLVDRNELIRLVNTNLPMYEKIRYCIIANEKLPRNTLGKIDRQKAISIAKALTVFNFLEQHVRNNNEISEDRPISKEDSLFFNLNYDSLSILDLIISCEDNYKIEIADDEAVELQTIDDFIKIIIKKAKKFFQ